MNLAAAIQRCSDAGASNGYYQMILDSLKGVNYLTPQQQRTALTIISRLAPRLGIELPPMPNGGGGIAVSPRYVYLAERDSFGLLFPPDPYIIVRVKELPGRTYAPKPKPHWLIPITPLSAPQVIRFAIDNHFDFSEDILIRLSALEPEEKEYKANVQASTAQAADISIPSLAGELRPFQKAAVVYALKNPHCIIGDEMGLGKTVEALATIEAANAYPALIVCPASAKGVWENHAVRWLPRKGVGVSRNSGWDYYPRGADTIAIINYDVLRREQEYLSSVEWKSIVFDEFHYIKNGDSQRSKLSKQIAKNTPMILMLSGTPVLNRPIELAHPLDILGLLPKLGGFWGFANRYAAAKQKKIWMKFKGKPIQKTMWDFTGADHTAELHEKLQGMGYIRRLKKDVLKDLPPKQRTLVPMPISNRDTYDAAERQIAKQLKDGSSPTIQLTRFEKLKRLAMDGKIAGCIEWITDFLESGEKLIVFAWHRDTVEAIANHFSAPMIRGDTRLEDRDAAVWDFQNDPTVRLIVCNIQAGGVSITLTAASNVCFVELPWNSSALLQAEDRAHRLGQRDSVSCYYLIDEDTIEGEVWDLIVRKWAVTDSVIDGGPESVGDSLVNSIIARIIARYATDAESR